jgi:hypothetical protein
MHVSEHFVNVLSVFFRRNFRKKVVFLPTPNDRIPKHPMVMLLSDKMYLVALSVVSSRFGSMLSFCIESLIIFPMDARKKPFHIPKPESLRQNTVFIQELIGNKIDLYACR